MFRLFFFICFLIYLFLPTSGIAFPWPVDEDTTETKKHFYKLKIDSSAMRFFSEKDYRYFSSAEIKAQQPLFEKSSFHLKANYTYSWMEDHHYFRPHELNIKFARPDGEWIFGRQQKEWDWADQFWSRGLWQPAYIDDTLRPQWAGLTGIFRNFNYEEGQTSLFGSFIFIPDFTPPFENKNGKLISKNPWFIAPPSGKIGSTNIVPVYKTSDPDLKDFLRLSFGGQASYKGAYIAYAYKPMNKIKAKSQIILPLHEEPKGSHEAGYLVNTPLEPVILRHHLLSSGFILQTAEQNNTTTGSTNYLLKTSVTYNHPEKHTPEDATWIFFQPQKEWYLSAAGEVRIKDTEEETTLHVGYTHQIQLEGEKNILSKTFPDIEKQFFREDLFQFSRAVSAGFTHSIIFNQDYSAKLKTRIIYHLLQEYFLVSFYGSLTFAKAFSIFLSGDLLFSSFPFTIEQTTKNIGVYANKSRIFGGISYAF